VFFCAFKAEWIFGDDMKWSTISSKISHSQNIELTLHEAKNGCSCFSVFSTSNGFREHLFCTSQNSIKNETNKSEKFLSLFI
jgi:hypothetical protein